MIKSSAPVSGPAKLNCSIASCTDSPNGAFSKKSSSCALSVSILPVINTSKSAWLISSIDRAILLSGKSYSVVLFTKTLIALPLVVISASKCSSACQSALKINSELLKCADKLASTGKFCEIFLSA